MIEQSGGARFFVGQVICHQRFGYRGVIVDVDPTYGNGEQWYEQMASSNPPKDKPWYHVLVHRRGYETYVAERNLAPDTTGEPVEHRLVTRVFRPFADGMYRLRGEPN